MEDGEYTFSPLLTELTLDSRCSTLQARDAVSELAVVASRYDKNGIDIYFLNNTDVKATGVKYTVRYHRFSTDNNILT